jgi:hypothetical protein
VESCTVSYRRILGCLETSRASESSCCGLVRYTIYQPEEGDTVEMTDIPITIRSFKDPYIIAQQVRFPPPETEVAASSLALHSDHARHHGFRCQLLRRARHQVRTDTRSQSVSASPLLLSPASLSSVVLLIVGLMMAIPPLCAVAGCSTMDDKVRPCSSRCVNHHAKVWLQEFGEDSRALVYDQDVSNITADDIAMVRPLGSGSCGCRRPW